MFVTGDPRVAGRVPSRRFRDGWGSGADAAGRWPLARERAGVSGSGSPTYYEIRVEAVLDSRWAAWFEDLQVQSDGTETVISGLLADQPALHGLLVKVRDLGLCLISVHRLDADEARTSAQQEGEP